MWKVSSTEEQTRDGRRISEPSVSLISFDMQSYSLGKPMGGSAHMKINRKSARQAGNHDDSQADWQKEEHTCKHTAAKLICKQIIKQARSSERHRNPGGFFWMTLTIFPSLCAFVQEYSNYDEWTVTEQREVSEKGAFLQFLINLNTQNICNDGTVLVVR